MQTDAIYIHVPWCKRRCPYCDFYFVVGKPNDNFFNALKREWQQRKDDYGGILARSLYFGGGTPSLLKPSVLDQIIKFFIDEKVLCENAEITLEANPEDLSFEFCSELAKTKINRISVGIQSFDDEILKILGRKHTSLQANTALKNLLENNFLNISVDLIVGVLGEKPSQIIDTLEYLNDVDIPHISTYLLTIEQKTKFDRLIESGRMVAPDEEAQVQIYRAVQQKLSALGYFQYDISSYGKANYFSRHNQVYWGQGNYIGLGPGAHSMRLLADGSIERIHNQASLTNWLTMFHKEMLSSDLLSPFDALKESLAFGLRNMSIGIKPELIAKRHALTLPQEFFSVVKKAKNYQWLIECDDSLKITPEGALFADSIMRDILCL